MVTDATAPNTALWRLLRLGAGLCFIGHGVFGLLRKEAWLPYFALVGLGPDAARALMPLVGLADVLVGILVLVRPVPVAAAYMVGWATWTALLRPLAGEPAWETLERAGNYGVPLALLLAGAWGGPARDWRSWLRPMSPRPLTPALALRLRTVLALTTAALLIGHAGLGIGGKALLVEHYAALGVALPTAGAVAPAIGWMELLLAGAVAWRPTALMGGLAGAWKLASESLFLVAGAPVWEFVERAGSYAAPLALLLLPAAWAAGTTRARRQRTRLPRLRGAGGLPALALPFALPFALAAALLAMPAREATAQQAADGAAPSAPPMAPAALIALLRQGGLVLTCRHAITVDDASDRGPAREQQRNLSAEGEEQARRLGVLVRAAGVPIGPVFASPMYRTRESAELAFGEATLTAALRGPTPEERRMLFTEPPPAGTNRVLMTHQGVLYGALPTVRRGSVGEGDCLVLRPGREAGVEVLGRLAVTDWR